MSFNESFGGEPNTAWQAPGRVNLMGDHTDYNNGFVLPFAIPLATTVSASLRDDRTLGLASAQHPAAPIRVDIDALTPNSNRWTCYLEGAVWLLDREGVRLPGADIFVDSAIPLGAGLSSSAALSCAALCAILELTDHEWPHSRIATSAQRIENDYVGAPVGIMDPTVIMQAQANRALFIDCRTSALSQVPFVPQDHGMSLLVVNTGSPHRTSDGVYAERVNECRLAAKALDVESLRDVTGTPGIAALQDTTLAARARHVVTENHRVLRTRVLLESGDVAGIGPLMTQSHTSLRDDYEVSTPELDLVVDTAVAAGALGARMTGAGLGGSAVVLAFTDEIRQLERRLRSRFGQAGLPVPETIAVRPSTGTRRLRSGSERFGDL